MVTISIYGLDQYTVGHYSKDHTKNLANLLEVSEDNVSFYAPNAYVFHNGVEQTSWNAIVKVNAPEACEANEAKVAKYLLETLKDFSINLQVEFYYYHKHHHYEHINEEYPRFIKEDNIVNVEDEYDEDSELYEGNIFEGFEQQLEEAAKLRERQHEEEHHDHDCDCGHDHHKH